MLILGRRRHNRTNGFFHSESFRFREFPVETFEGFASQPRGSDRQEIHSR